MIILFLFVNTVAAQKKIGVELRYGQNITYNTGSLVTDGPTSYYFDVNYEGNPTTSSYSIGIVYALANYHTFKLHFGRHSNGRVLSIIEFGDMPGEITYYNYADKPYDYIQLNPSYVFSLSKSIHVISMELGVAINKRINMADTFFVGINDYHFDFRSSIGYALQLTTHLSVGVNGVFSKSLKDYQDKIFINGEYKPLQLGIECNVKYYL